MSFEWPRLPLSEIAEVFTGFAFKGDKYLPPKQGVRVVRGDNVTERFVRWGEKEKCWNAVTEDLKPYLLRVGDVVIGMDGSKVGRNFAAISYKDDGSLLAQRVARVRAKKGASQDFIRYLICNQDFTNYVQSVHTGTSIPHISKGQIERFEVSVPPLKFQNAIAKILVALDDRITLLRDTNQTLEAIAQALFKSWFVDFDPVRAKAEGRLTEGIDAATAALFPDAFEESELGVVPKGWAFQAVGDLLVPKRGKSITKTKCVEGDIPVVAGGLEPAYFHNQSNVSSPVVTISASGANAGFVRLYQQDIWASDCSFVSAEQTEAIYFWYVFLKFNQEKIYFMQQGAAQPHIYPSDLIRLHICSSQTDKLRGAFNSLVSPLFDRIGLNGAKIHTLSNLRDTLLPRLISGQLRIADAEAELEKAKA